MNRKTGCVVAVLFSTVLFGQQTDFDAMLNVARGLQLQGKIKEAVDVADRAVRQFPDNPSARSELASMLGALAGNAANTGDFSAAMTHSYAAFSQLDTALVLNPNHFDANFIYGVFAVNVPAFMGKLDAGVSRMEKAKALAEAKQSGISIEQKAALFRYLGQGYKMQNRINEAEAAWKTALSLLPSGQNADAARKGLEEIRTAKTEPKSLGIPINGPPVSGVQSLIELGKVRLNEKKWEEAVETLRKAVQQDSSNAEAVLLLARALGEEAMLGYDERIYRDQTWRTNLAFELTRILEKAHRNLPDNPEIRLFYALMCVQMPFFVGKTDEGLSILEAMSKDTSLPDSIRTEATYQFGFGLRKKGRGVWADFVKNNPDAEQASLVYREYGLRENSPKPAKGERVQVQFHLGFQDELEPQTALWVEDADGRFVKTLYVSGFSGFVKEKQVVLPEFAKRTKFETDGNTGASVDWGKTSFDWNLTGPSGKRVKPGAYTVVLEVSWWPSMRYEVAEAQIRIGGKTSETTLSREPFIPRLRVQYLPK
jgi:tetratricopeptide (TPR) repeat protein